MVTLILGILSIVEPMAKVFTNMLMAHFKKVIGLMTNCMAREKNIGQMEPLILDSIIVETNMGVEYFNGLMESYMMGISSKIEWKDLERKNGLMVKFMKDIGRATKWMDKENLYGLKDSNTLDRMLWTKKKD